MWDAATGRRIGEAVRVLWGTPKFIPDGRLVLVMPDTQSFRFLDAVSGQPVGPERNIHAGLVRYVFTPDGRQVLAALDKNQVTHFPVPQPIAGDPARLTLWLQVRTGMELDADGRLRWLDAGTWNTRRQQLADIGGPHQP